MRKPSKHLRNVKAELEAAFRSARAQKMLNSTDQELLVEMQSTKARYEMLKDAWTALSITRRVHLNAVQATCQFVLDNHRHELTVEMIANFYERCVSFHYTQLREQLKQRRAERPA